ncbi:hypothetical protein PRK78_001148 [Emydomyces testavorans]|uniref:Uncharacterized protein n=1 Tax=Emydomyces testavorans TaxID=2070801 RepID=A0AAF0DCX8_9EURO|nr:hypothetical protein PRK78_001148 [Emydomyces testavorans]
MTNRAVAIALAERVARKVVRVRRVRGTRYLRSEGSLRFFAGEEEEEEEEERDDWRLVVRRRGTRNMQMKVRTAAVRKSANIQWEAMRARLRAWEISLGSATGEVSFSHLDCSRQKLGILERERKGSLLVAPESSSFSSISTGLKKYILFGLKQYVIPEPSL